MPQNPQRLKAARVLEALHIGQAVMVDGMKLVMIDGQIFIEAQAYRYRGQRRRDLHHRRPDRHDARRQAPGAKPMKPLGRKAYGSIPHLPNSKLGPRDYHIHQGQADILTKKTSDKHDLVIIQEKLDGSCCAIANVDGRLVPLTRAGHPATTSKYEQHHLFAHWVRENQPRFAFLQPGQRVVGEWLAQAPSARYQVDDHSVFVAFDLMEGATRAPSTSRRSCTSAPPSPSRKRSSC